jgi:hypothetical protein
MMNLNGNSCLTTHNKQATTHNKRMVMCVCACDLKWGLVVLFVDTGEIVDHHCLIALFIIELEILLTCDIHLYSFPRRSNV